MSHQSPSVDQLHRPSHTPDQSSTESKIPVAPKRLHISNIPFKYREDDLRQLFSVSEVINDLVYLIWASQLF